MTYKYREEVRGLHTAQTAQWALEAATNPRAKAFDLLSYARLTDEAKAYLQQFIQNREA